jgi:hypothetical protein
MCAHERRPRLKPAVALYGVYIMKTLTGEQLGKLGEALERALDLREEDGEMTWDCGHDHAATVRILGDMGLSYEQIEAATEELNSLGGYCDCEVMMNVICGPEGERAAKPK